MPNPPGESTPHPARAGASAIVKALREAGHTAYFAGGCVRDELLGNIPSDYDVATDARPERIAQLFPRSSHVGAAFGVVLIHPPKGASQEEAIEVATFRTDGAYSDSRRPDAVAFSTPEADAARRDFTVNGLFLDPFDSPQSGDGPLPAGWSGGRVIDFVDGLADLNARVLRAVGEPSRRLAEDHLRALRAARLAARLAFSIDPATSEAIRKHAAELRGVSRERIGDELRRMFNHPSRAAGAALIHELALERPVLTEPEWSLRGRPRTLSGIDKSASFGVALAAWSIDLGVPSSVQPAIAFTDQVRRALCLSNDECQELSAALEGLLLLRTEWSGWTIARQRRFAESAQFRAGIDLLSVVQPDAAKVAHEKRMEFHAMAGGPIPLPFLTGDDLVAMGLRPGPRFKHVLDVVYDAQLEGRVGNVQQARELAARLCV